MAGIRSTKGPFLILSLLFVVYVESSFNIQDRMETLMGNFQRAIKEVAREMEEEKDQNEMTLKLLDAARSLTDENTLEIFEETLQEAVDQANRHQRGYRERIEDASNQFDKQLKNIYPALQLLKMQPPDSPVTQDLLNAVERTLKKVKMYLDMKKQSLTGNREYTEKMLKEIANVFHHDVHIEL